jgi:hypothetical protein
MTYINIRAVKGIGIIMSNMAKTIKYIRILVFGFIIFSSKIQIIINLLYQIANQPPQVLRDK